MTWNKCNAGSLNSIWIVTFSSSQAGWTSNQLSLAGFAHVHTLNPTIFLWKKWCQWPEATRNASPPREMCFFFQETLLVVDTSSRQKFQDSQKTPAMESPVVKTSCGRWEWWMCPKIAGMLFHFHMKNDETWEADCILGGVKKTSPQHMVYPCIYVECSSAYDAKLPFWWPRASTLSSFLECGMFTHRNMMGNSFEFLYLWRFKSCEHHLYMGIFHCHVRLPEGIGCPPRHGPIISKNPAARKNPSSSRTSSTMFYQHV